MTVLPARPPLPAALPAVAVAAIVLTVGAPWLLGFDERHAAIADHIAFAMAVVPIASLLGALAAAAPATIAAGSVARGGLRGCSATRRRDLRRRSPGWLPAPC